MTPRYLLRATAFMACALTGILAPGGGQKLAAADEPKTVPAGRAAVAKCVTPTGTLFRREAPGKPWQIVKEGETLYSGDLLLGLPGAALESRNGAVRMDFVSDPSGLSPLPIVETAVVLNDSKDVDLDVFLERGLIDLVNRQGREKARIRARIRKDGAGGVIVAEPGARSALEVFGRWPAGVPFKKNAGPDHVPTLAMIFVVLRGEVTIHLGGRQFAMTAPPGPAFVMMDSVGGADFNPQRLEKLPDWVTQAADSKLAQKKKAMAEEFRKLVQEKSIEAALDAFIHSDDPDKRRAAVNAMGAMDDLLRLANVLANAKHADTWDYGVRALRHWIGRGPGQDQKLYDALIKEGKFSDREAETVMQLLHSFGEDQLTKPELYEVLIDFLDHNRLAIRGLAHWHLYRLVPDGRKIGYNPLDSKEARQKAIELWRKLIPPGKLPPEPKVDDK